MRSAQFYSWHFMPWPYLPEDFDERYDSGWVTVRNRLFDHEKAKGLYQSTSRRWGCIELAYLKSVRGELAQAVPLLERALAQSCEWNITSHTPIVLACLGHVSALAGRSAEGVSWLEEAVTGYDSAGMGSTTRSASSGSARPICLPTGWRTRAPPPNAP